MTREKQYQISCEYLDQLDWDKYLEKGADIQNIMDEIENDTDNLPPMPKEFNGYVFNFLNEGEFCDYLEKRGLCRIMIKEKHIIWKVGK